MLGLLGLSMLSLVFRKHKVMFTGLACTAAMCIFLINASNSELKLPTSNTKTKVSVAHLNLSNIASDIQKVVNQFKSDSIDLISFQELTPDWHPLLEELLAKDYPYNSSLVRIDPFGMAVYSKYPFILKDTFMVEEKPGLNVVLKKENCQFDVFSSYLIPALDKMSRLKASNQLTSIASKVNESNLPVIALGEYNMVYWTNEIRTFRTKTDLRNSRRDLVQGNLRVPYDHIFFSGQLECIKFEEIWDEEQNYVGIQGVYQIKDKDTFETLNSQLSLID